MLKAKIRKLDDEIADLGAKLSKVDSDIVRENLVLKNINEQKDNLHQ